MVPEVAIDAYLFAPSAHYPPCSQCLAYLPDRIYGTG